MEADVVEQIGKGIVLGVFLAIADSSFQLFHLAKSDAQCFEEDPHHCLLERMDRV